ncbi:MAG TPA: hypothetical protein VM677_06340 [Actinokineospora sp.]|nr:hypothetical protein [Actinokineospora sp.]
MPDTRDLEARVIKLQRNTAALLSLLGGDDDDRLRFWEILKGITTPAEYKLVSHSLDVMQAQVDQVELAARSIETAAKEMGRVRAG